MYERDFSYSINTLPLILKIMKYRILVLAMGSNVSRVERVTFEQVYFAIFAIFVFGFDSNLSHRWCIHGWCIPRAERGGYANGCRGNNFISTRSREDTSMTKCEYSLDRERNRGDNIYAIEAKQIHTYGTLLIKCKHMLM